MWPTLRYRCSMRSVVAIVTSSSALVALLFTASCLEPDRNNGEPCLSDDQCESNYCRAGVCTTPPETDEASNLPPPVEAGDDASTDAAEDAAEDAADDTGEPADAEPDVADDAASEAGSDASEDASEDAASDAPDDAPAEASDAAEDAAGDAQTD